MEHSVTYVLVGLTISLAVLIFGAERFTHSAEKVGVALGMPEFTIGVLIISLGTSLPELISSIFAVLKGSPTIVAGSVVGSNVTNTFLVLGLAFLFFKGNELKVNLIHVDVPVLLAVSILFVFMCYDGDYSWADGVFSLIAAGLYIWVTLKRKPVDSQEDAAAAAEAGADTRKKEPLKPTAYIMMVVSSVMLYFGGENTVEFINEAAAIFKVNEGVVAGTAIALAAALPEVLICSKLALRGKLDMAIGNIVGASVFNCLAVMGVASFFGPSGHLSIAPETIQRGLPMMLASVFCFIFVTIDKRIEKPEGVVFLMLYIFYVGDIIGWL